MCEGGRVLRSPSQKTRKVPSKRNQGGERVRMSGRRLESSEM